MAAVLLRPSWFLPEAAAGAPRSEHAVAVRDARIAAIGPAPEVERAFPGAQRIDLPGCLVMPGWINAHQHGRGLSQIQLGHADDFLEPWIAGRRAKGVLDPYVVTRLAALEMTANGVTCAVHANYSYGTGDYEAELRAQLRAYDEVGLRVTLCVGLLDQGALVYGPDACFLDGLSNDVRNWLASSGPRTYAGGVSETIALMGRLLSDYAGHPTIQLCYGPAGPQWVSDQAWMAIARDAERWGLVIHTHALESPAQADYAAENYPEGAIARLDSLGALGPRTVLAHGVWVSDADIELIAKRNAIVVRNPGCNLRMRNGIAPLARYLKQGVQVAIGTDNCALNDDEDLFAELRLAGQLAREPSWRGLAPPGVRQLLEMLTVNGALAAGAETLGRLTEGAPADLVAVSLESAVQPYLDPEMPLLQAMLARTSGADVRLTMVNGAVVFRDGRHPKIDREQARRAAAHSAGLALQSVNESSRKHAREFARSVSEHYRSRHKNH